MTDPVPELLLSNGVRIPQVGFGVFRVPDDATTERAVRTAIEVSERVWSTIQLSSFATIW
jgi:2,5-diketo-D-gluconate reductase A